MTKRIQLTNGGEAIVDDCDFDVVSVYRWVGHASVPDYPYAQAKRHGRTVLLHRLLMGARPGQQVDHINGNGLDCRRANMRLCDAAQNQWNARLRTDNKSGFKGVHFNTAHGKWHATIKVRGQLYYLGSFDCPEDAAQAYDDAAREYHGQFARGNGM